MGRFLDFVFNRFFLGMIATAFFWLLTLAGGIILGLAPASATLMSLYAEHGYSFREYSLKEAWSLYKQNFVSSNLIFYSFLGVGLVLTYLIVGLSLLFIVILYLTLRQTFANYQKQVVDLVESIQVIAQGEEGRRIDISEKDQELLLIAETTNDMLDRLEKNIHDIYQLELSQKDANMRALQAQINPHFMYNTLEFLRMYAVMQSQDELADIIYEFSSLLRNNISDERETLLKQELEFCRKYSYLCMVRYPKSIAYGFKIDPELENMKIPKFTLQPLVENYFAHGVDHRRTDNVISIKALKQDGFVEILVVDNGRGMSAEKLANIREKLSQRYFEHQASYSDQRQSIGIVNVHERFVLYFGDRYAITIESAEQAGVQYRITIQDE
ncbi:sensor histidine kinase [Streptococcus pneumoniae]|nr:sensor histidine kinase [Streptococcus pneumoniae]